MVSEVRNAVIVSLENYFTAEQLQMIDLAVAKALQGYNLEKQETLPMARESVMSADIKEFLARKRLKGCSDGTITQYSMALERFCMWLRKDIRSVQDIDILAYLDYRMSRDNVSKRTLDNNRLILSSFFTFMHDTGKMSWNPSRTVDPIKYKAAIREPLNDIELEKVRNACVTPRERALFEVLYASGARVSEIASINYADIDPHARTTIITGKGDQERYIFLSAKAMVAIENYLATRKDNNPALFVSAIAPHDRLGKNSIESEIARIGERSGIGRPVFPHLLRHTFATDMLCHGVEINEVSKMLGHKKLETTQIYAKTSREMLENAHKKHVA